MFQSTRPRGVRREQFIAMNGLRRLLRGWNPTTGTINSRDIDVMGDLKRVANHQFWVIGRKLVV